MVAAAEEKGYGAAPEPTITAPEPDGAVKKVESEAKPEAKVEAKPAAIEDEGYSLEEDGFVGAKDLAAKIDANEALKAALPSDVRNEIMANARLAERGAAYDKFFASPQEAEVVAQTAQEFAAHSEAFSLVGRDVKKGTTAFVQKLIEGSALRDDNGNILKDAQGNIQTDGTAGKFFDEIFTRGLAMKIEEKIEASGDPNLKGALAFVMESVGLRASTADKDEDQDPAVTARKAELDAQEARITAKEQSQRTEAHQQFQTTLNAEVLSTYEGEVQSLLSKATGLSELERSAVEKEIDAAVLTARKSNVAYNERKRILEQQPMSVGRRQREVALVKQFLRENLVRLARPILSKAGVALSKKVESQAAVEAARAEAARSEVNGGAATGQANPGTPQNPQQQYAAVAADLKAKLGREPSDTDVNIEMMLRAAKARGVQFAA